MNHVRAARGDFFDFQLPRDIFNMRGRRYTDISPTAYRPSPDGLDVQSGIPANLEPSERKYIPVCGFDPPLLQTRPMYTESSGVCQEGVQPITRHTPAMSTPPPSSQRVRWASLTQPVGTDQN